METEKIKFTDFFSDQKYWIVVLFLTLLLGTSLAIFGLRKEPKSNQIVLPKQEKSRILKNKKIWSSFCEAEKKKWKSCRERFQRYDFHDQQFLQQLYKDWQILPSTKKRQMTSCYKIFCGMPQDVQENLKYKAIFLEGMVWDAGNPANSLNLQNLQKWLNDDSIGEDVQEFKKYCQKYCKHCIHSPLALRREIYQSIGTVKMLPLLPANLQKYWKTLPLETRINILSQIKKQSEKQRRFLLMQLLKQKMDVDTEFDK